MALTSGVGVYLAKKMKHIRHVFALCCALTPSWVGALLLEEAVIENIEKHPLVIEQLKDFNASNEDVEIAKAGYLPTLDLQTGAGYEKYRNRSSGIDRGNDVTEARVILKQNLFNGYGTKYDVQRNMERRSAAAYRYLEQANLIAFETIEKYITLLKINAQKDLALEQTVTHQKIFASIRSKAESGAGKASELDRAAGRLAVAQSNYIAYQNKHKEAVYNFHKLQGRFVDGSSMVMPVFNSQLLPNNLDEGIKTLFKYNPSLHVAAKNVEVQRSNRKYDIKNFLPTVDFELSKEWKNDLDGVNGHTNDLKAMVYLNWNLFSGNADVARQRKGASQINKEYEHKNSVKRDLINSMQLIWSDYSRWKRQLKLIARNEALMRKVLKSYHVEFRLGQRRLINVLDAEIEYYQARVNMIEADYSLLISQYRLLFSMGTLLGSFGQLSLPKEIDKAVHDVEIARQPEDALPIDAERDMDKVMDYADVCAESLGNAVVSSSGCDKMMAERYLTDMPKVEYQAAIGHRYVKEKDDLEHNKLNINEVALFDYQCFRHGTLRFSRQSNSILRPLIKQLRGFGKNVIVEITVYSQDHKDKAKDKILSVRRGYNLKKVLAKNGIEVDNIIVFGEVVDVMQESPENYLELKIVDRFEYVQDNYEPKINSKIGFKKGGLELAQQALQELEGFSRQISHLGEIEINIISHSNDFGSAEERRMISEKRAQMIKVILVENGVTRALIIPHGSGDYNTIDYSIHSDGRNPDNLIEIVVKKRGMRRAEAPSTEKTVAGEPGI